MYSHTYTLKDFSTASVAVDFSVAKNGKSWLSWLSLLPVNHLAEMCV